MLFFSISSGCLPKLKPRGEITICNFACMWLVINRQKWFIEINTWLHKVTLEVDVQLCCFVHFITNVSNNSSNNFWETSLKRYLHSSEYIWLVECYYLSVFGWESFSSLSKLITSEMALFFTAQLKLVVFTTHSTLQSYTWSIRIRKFASTLTLIQHTLRQSIHANVVATELLAWFFEIFRSVS